MKKLLQLSTETLGYLSHASVQARRVCVTVIDQSGYCPGVGTTLGADQRAGEERKHPDQVSRGDPARLEQGRLSRQQTRQGRRLLYQEANEQDQNRRRGAIDRRATRADLVRERDGVCAVFVSGRGALRVAAVD